MLPQKRPGSSAGATCPHDFVCTCQPAESSLLMIGCKVPLPANMTNALKCMLAGFQVCNHAETSCSPKKSFTEWLRLLALLSSGRTSAGCCRFLPALEAILSWCCLLGCLPASVGFSLKHVVYTGSCRSPQSKLSTVLVGGILSVCLLHRLVTLVPLHGP